MERRTIIISSVVLTLAVAVSAIAALPENDNDADAVKATVSSAAELNTGELKANVAVAAVRTVTLNKSVRINGITTADKDIIYAAETAGRLEYLGADIGDNVRQGKVLARVDYAALRAARMQAQASYDLAKATWQRMTVLGADLVSAQKIDESKFNLQGAKANLELASAQAANAVVRSGGRGTVAEKFVEEGEYVAPGAPLFRIVDMRTIVVEAAVPESQVTAVAPGAEVTVHIAALNSDYKGTVKALLPKANPQSHTFTVRVAVKNPNAEILVGMSASLIVDAGTEQSVVSIPQDLVIEGAGERHVFVVENNIAKKRVVSPGQANGEEVVVTAGLRAGDRVVTFGHRDLLDGKPVRIVSKPLAF